MQQIRPRISVVHIGRRDLDGVVQLSPAVDPDMHLHPEVPLLALRGLMHLRISLLVLVLGRGRRAGFGSRRGRRPEELVDQSGALTLLTNLVLARNTAELQRALERWRAETGRRIHDATHRHISPANFEQSNVNGALMFPVE